MYTPALIRSNFSRLLPDSHRRLKAKSLLALATALLLAPALFAQQDPERQYPPDQSGNQQFGYGQPGYAQPQPYEPQVDSQPVYPDQNYPQQPYSGDGQAENQQDYPQLQSLSEQQLEQLVAPIALYPDSLVAQA